MDSNPSDDITEDIQEKILQFIKEYNKVKGYAPTVDQIVIETGISSFKIVNDCLSKLEKSGYIEQNRLGIRLKSPDSSKNIMHADRKLRVFLCHASQDKPVVRELYQRLLAEGWIDPWLDEEKLLPGQDWDIEIEKAVESSDVVVVCLSNNSVTKEGYIQKELRFVLDVSDEKPEETIFVAPIRFDECLIPRRLRKWQYVDYFPKTRKDWAYKRLLMALDIRFQGQKNSFEELTPTLIEQVSPVLNIDVDQINEGIVSQPLSIKKDESTGTTTPSASIAVALWLWLFIIIFVALAISR